MKTTKILKLSIIILLFFCSETSIAQNDSLKTKSLWVITTNDGGEFIGEIISQDSKEVLIHTKDRGEISIPKYQIKEMKELTGKDVNQNGDYVPEEIFSTRYFITTNGLPIKKGENYLLWNLFGPDFEFGVAKNLSVGVLTTWFAYPIVANAKYTYSPREKVSLGGGLLLGTSTWGSGNYYIGFSVPYFSLTYGDRKSNISLSIGISSFVVDGYEGNRPLGALSGMSKVGKKVNLVFDSFILLPNKDNDISALLIPGIRIQTNPDRAFQFGFAGIVANGEAVPLPIPFVQWFKKI